MKYGFFPGCSLQASAVEYARSSLAVLETLGVEVEEIDDWVCCGATPAHATSHLLSIALPAINCAQAAKQGLDVLTCCAACYSRLKQANEEMRNHTKLREQINSIIEEQYEGKARVLHIAEVLGRGVGLQTIHAAVQAPLNGLKVACYYGCLMARLPEHLRVDRTEYPMLMDDILAAAGARPVDWGYKTECCGAGLTLARQKTVVRLSGQIIRMAKESGADAIAVACPLCQANLDMFQADAERETGEPLAMPVLYFTQLLGLALGVEKERLGLEKLIVDPLPLLCDKGLAVGAVHL